MLVKAGLKMKRYQLSLAGLIVASCLGMTTISYGEDRPNAEHDKTKANSETSRPVVKDLKVSYKFDSL